MTSRAKPKTSKKTCSSCAFLDDGACRRFPPQRALTTRADQDVDYTVWPVMRPELDWCGEWRKRGRAA